MEKWSGKDYIGERYDEYYLLYSHHRDSDIINESNYQTLKKIFIDLPGVIERSANHWAVGWVEYLLIHEKEHDTLVKGEYYLGQLKDYPILDEDDFSNRDYDLVCQYADDVMNEINNAQGFFCFGAWVDEDIQDYLIKDGFNKNMTREEVIDHIYQHDLIDR